MPCRLNTVKFLCIHYFKATRSNPWQAQVVVEEQEDDDEGPTAGFSLVAQMLACESAYGGDVSQAI